MKEKKSSTYRRPGAIALCALIVTAMAMPVFAKAQAEKRIFGMGIERLGLVDKDNKKIGQGRLKIVGKGIEHIVLIGEDNHRQEFPAPGEILSLPPGEYRPEQIRLKGGFSYKFYSRPHAYTFKIDPNSTTELKMGSPLTQTITVNRKGKILQLGYGLHGIGGEEYTDARQEKPPEFAVYKGDKKVGGGKFEFG